MRTQPKPLVISMLCASIVMVPIATKADVQDKMDQMFSSRMVAVTNPGSYESTTHRGVFGGSITARNEIINTNLINFIPPSGQSGCGGQDLFGGSFSFINSDQIVALFRAVAANAKGYAFQFALSAISEKASKHIEALQRKIQQMNKYLGNSCQMAQGIVNFGKEAFENHEQAGQKLKNAAAGVGDFFTTWSTNDGQNATEEQLANDPTTLEEETQGNILWRQLKKHNAGAFMGIGDDDRFLEVLMSYTGSYIVGEPVDDADGNKTLPKTPLAGGLITLRDIIDGKANAKVYNCDGEGQHGCLTPTTREVDIEGFKFQLNELLTGDGAGDPGLIGKFATPAAASMELSDQQKALLSGMPRPFGGMINRIATKSPEAAISLANSTSQIVALEMAYNLLDNMLATAIQASSDSDKLQSEKLEEALRDRRQSLQTEYQTLSQQYGSIKDIYAHFTDIAMLMPNSVYLPDGGIGPSAAN